MSEEYTAWWAKTWATVASVQCTSGEKNGVEFVKTRSVIPCDIYVRPLIVRSNSPVVVNMRACVRMCVRARAHGCARACV